MPKDQSAPEAEALPAEEAAPVAGQIRVTALVNIDDLKAGETIVVTDSDEWRARVDKGLVALT